MEKEPKEIDVINSIIEPDNNDVIETLLDPDNSDDVVIYDENDNPHTLEQISNVLYKGKTYALLSFVNDKDISSDYVYVFEIDVENNTLHLIDKDRLIDKIIKKYIRLYKSIKNV